VVVAFY
jgi:hypothetical protein